MTYIDICRAMPKNILGEDYILNKGYELNEEKTFYWVHQIILETAPSLLKFVCIKRVVFLYLY